MTNKAENENVEAKVQNIKEGNKKGFTFTVIQREYNGKEKKKHTKFEVNDKLILFHSACWFFGFLLNTLSKDLNKHLNKHLKFAYANFIYKKI